tara:strand:+ start:250 stop:627 length:378 start_codon:yes stop_codon:yes gene_type:complete
MAQQETGVNIEQAFALANEWGMSVTFGDNGQPVFTPAQVEQVAKTTAKPTKATPAKAKPTNAFYKEVIVGGRKSRQARKNFREHKANGRLPRTVDGALYTLKQAIAMGIATKSGNPTAKFKASQS